MSRKRSSNSQHYSTPFTSIGAAVPPLALNNWRAGCEEPFSSYSATSENPPASKTRRTGTGKRSASIPNISVDVTVHEDPRTFYQTNTSPHNLSPIAPPTRKTRRASSATTNQHPAPAYTMPSPTLAVPPASAMSPSTLSRSTTTTGSDALTHTSPITSVDMSRQSSFGGSSFCGGFDMMRINSQGSENISNSGIEQSPLQSNRSFSHPPHHNPVPSSLDQSYAVSHVGAMVDDADPYSGLGAANYLGTPFNIENDIGMARSTSSTSNNSAISRVFRRSQEQAAQSSRPLAPKEQHSEPTSRQSTTSSLPEIEMARQISEDGKKVSIPKSTYHRRPEAKLPCRKCNKHPDGFRGAHELQRHEALFHSVLRKSWICQDASINKDFLRNCNVCASQKQYGAYYNAAAHLRRLHFDPRQKGRRTKGQPQQKRGGQGGGKHPPMRVLKRDWMRQIEELVPDDAPPLQDEDISLGQAEGALAIADDADEDTSTINGEEGSDLRGDSSIMNEINKSDEYPWSKVLGEFAGSNYTQPCPNEFDQPNSSTSFNSMVTRNNFIDVQGESQVQTLSSSAPTLPCYYLGSLPTLGTSGASFTSEMHQPSTGSISQYNPLHANPNVKTSDDLHHSSHFNPFDPNFVDLS